MNSQFMVVAANAEGAVPGADEPHRVMHDRSGVVQFEAGGHDQRRVHEAFEAVSTLNDLLDPLLYSVRRSRRRNWKALRTGGMAAAPSRYPTSSATPPNGAR